MATTLRDSTASLRSEEASVPQGSAPLPFGHSNPHTSTAVHPTCQTEDLWTQHIGKTLVSRAIAAAKTVLDLHSCANGSTVGLFDGNMAGRPLFAVSIY